MRRKDVGGRLWKLTYVEGGFEADIGDKLLDFRGDPSILIDGQPPHKPESTGRVLTTTGEYYPGVFGMHWGQVGWLEEHRGKA